MRLLQDDEHGNLNLVEYADDDKIPPYAILSHTWGLDGQEVTLRDLMEGAGKPRPGSRRSNSAKRKLLAIVYNTSGWNVMGSIDALEMTACDCTRTVLESACAKNESDGASVSFEDFDVV